MAELDKGREFVSPDDGGDEQSAAAGNASEPRRNFMVELAAVIVGGVTGVAGLIAGLIVYLDPLFNKKRPPLFYREGGDSGGDGFVRVASLDAVPDDGIPRRYPVIADQIDAWNFSPDVPIGSVYIRREANDFTVFHSTCPHAGCSVSYSHNADPKLAAFHCPCHNSSFNPDGGKRDSGGQKNPSPRDLDELEFEERDNELWIKFQDFYTGIHEQKAKL